MVIGSPSRLSFPLSHVRRSQILKTQERGAYLRSKHPPKDQFSDKGNTPLDPQKTAMKANILGRGFRYCGFRYYGFRCHGFKFVQSTAVADKNCKHRRTSSLKERVDSLGLNCLFRLWLTRRRFRVWSTESNSVSIIIVGTRACCRRYVGWFRS